MAARPWRPLVEDERIQDKGSQEGSILERARPNVAYQECPGADYSGQCIRVVSHARLQHHHKPCSLHPNPEQTILAENVHGGLCR